MSLSVNNCKFNIPINPLSVCWLVGQLLKGREHLFKIRNIKCETIRYRVFIKYCVFSLKGTKEKDQSPEYSKIFGKNTVFNEHPVCMVNGNY